MTFQEQHFISVMPLTPQNYTPSLCWHYDWSGKEMNGAGLASGRKIFLHFMKKCDNCSEGSREEINALTWTKRKRTSQANWLSAYVMILLNPVIYCLDLLKFLITIQDAFSLASEKRYIACAQCSKSCKNEINENVNSGGQYAFVAGEDCQ
jgi:hypothetical protein